MLAVVGSVRTIWHTPGVQLGVREIATATKGEARGNAEIVVDGAAIDSRALRPGQLFVAIRAERDGHDYVLVRSPSSGEQRRRNVSRVLSDRVW